MTQPVQHDVIACIDDLLLTQLYLIDLVSTRRNLHEKIFARGVNAAGGIPAAFQHCRRTLQYWVTGIGDSRINIYRIDAWLEVVWLDHVEHQTTDELDALKSSASISPIVDLHVWAECARLWV